MKKYVLFALMAMSLIFFSCKSTEQEDSQTEDTTVEQVEETDDTVPEQADENLSNAEKNEKLLSQVEESRSNAVKAGADKYYAEQLDATDAKLKELKEKAAGSNEDLSDELTDLNYRYLALQKAAETKNLKAKIDEHGFADSNRIAYDAADLLMAELEKVIQENADGKTMYKTADAAYAAYYAIFYDSFKKLAEKERDAAREQKKNADSVKAGVARKDTYKAITEIFQKGDNCFVTKNPEGAYENYKEAKEKYEALYKDVEEKRAEAQRRIDEAKAKVKAVEEFAGEADDVAPIGDEKIDGIEEKDTVLLEEDKFAEPEAAVIEVDESVKVEKDSAIEVFKDMVGVEER